MVETACLTRKTKNLAKGYFFYFSHSVNSFCFYKLLLKLNCCKDSFQNFGSFSKFLIFVKNQNFKK
jgi:hypothetical protein